VTGPAESPPPPAPNRPWAAHLLIPTLWTPEQALAVVELLDELREAVATLYASQIQDLLRDEQGHGDAADLAAGDGNPTENHSF
jgi:hypothetical protein